MLGYDTLNCGTLKNRDRHDVRGSQLARNEPFPSPSLLKACSPVVVYFEDFAVGGPNSVVVAVVTLPPPLVAQRGFPKPVVMPGFNYISDHVLSVTETEGNWNLDFTAHGNFDLLHKKLWSYHPIPTTLATY